MPGPGARGDIVECIAVGIEDVQIPVQIQINKGDSAASEIFVGRTVDEVDFE